MSNPSLAEVTSATPLAKAVPILRGGSVEADAGNVAQESQTAPLIDWIMGNQRMMSVLEQDFSQMEGYQWMDGDPGPM